MSANAHFGPELFAFLTDLRNNNNREWFQANKGRYQSDVLEPLQTFVADFGTRLHDISPHFVADPRQTGGSIFRIYRDVRFSKDKTPYKTHAAVHFRHGTGKDVHGPGYYLHLEPTNVYVGGGIWHPDPQMLGGIRDAIVANPARWQRILSDKQFAARFHLEGESLKRPPKGYDPDHPLIEDLKRKDFIVSASFSPEDAYAQDFADRFEGVCRQSAPLMEFLATSAGLPW